jgi:hypothetical protein
MNDMSQVIIPKSDQWNADDFIAGPQTFTIREVRINAGSEQPVNIVLEGTEKFYRPCKSMSRVLVGAWGADASKYVGRSLTLYRDPEVKWGGLAVGGIRISHMSDLDSEKTMVLTATKGSRKPFKIKPLVNAPRSQPSDFSAQLAELRDLAKPGNMDALGAKWQEIGADARKALAAELPALKAACEKPASEDVPFDAPAASPRTLGEQLADTPGEAKAAEIKTQLENAKDAAAVETIIADAEKHRDAFDDATLISLETAYSTARSRFEAERAKAGATEPTA